jgi:hypothetical protein
MQSTGLILHEIGHVIAAAFAAGIPTDYLIIDDSADAQRHGTYINETYRDALAQDVSAQIRIAAGGFAAEELIFGEACLNTSRDDLRRIARMLKRPFHDSQMPVIAQYVKRTYAPLIPFEATGLILEMYRMAAAAIESRQHWFERAHMIPFDILNHAALPIPLPDREAAAERTRLGADRDMILATLRSGVRPVINFRDEHVAVSRGDAPARS